VELSINKNIRLSVSSWLSFKSRGEVWHCTELFVHFHQCISVFSFLFSFDFPVASFLVRLLHSKTRLMVWLATTPLSFRNLCFSTVRGKFAGKSSAQFLHNFLHTQSWIKYCPACTPKMHNPPIDGQQNMAMHNAVADDEKNCKLVPTYIYNGPEGILVGC
jgi:hypothetical protein